MPAESQAQRRWAFGAKGSAWAHAHHFANKGKLPEKVGANAKLTFKQMQERGQKAIDAVNASRMTEGTFSVPMDGKKRSVK